ncbi:UDP-glucuronic acid decarboxylase family protein [Geminicoccus roseus]|uniref:UDP-glucuronic acid decarboxylase family protein n=1 Tax=Geminicoccus roseus TaxID=404900 RepID=UPI002AC35687|nr:UDP-glucuronic acid decarboxylase family protein [Geminicoccus roseus]
MRCRPAGGRGGEHHQQRELVGASAAPLREDPLEVKMPFQTRRSPPATTVLVAGGAGFLGSFLCERLIGEGKRVICLDSFRTGTPENLRGLNRDPRFSFLEADVCEPLPASMKVDQIYNLACPASPRHYQADPVHTLLTSVLGARNLLELARSNHARLLQASTSEVYGDPNQHPQRESYWGNVNPVGIRACYDEGKRAAEALCFDFMRTRHVDVRVARIFNTYGPRMRADDGRIVSNLIVQALSGRPLTIYGSGQQTRSFCFVTDLIEGLARLMEVQDNPRTPINIGNSDEYTINELAQLVSKLTGSASPVVYEPLPADDPHLRRPDITFARKFLNWAPRTSIGDGLKATISWFANARQEEQPSRRMFKPVDLALQPVSVAGATG